MIAQKKRTKIVRVLCPCMDLIPNLGIASIHSFFKKDFEIHLFDINIDFYKNTSTVKRIFFENLSNISNFFEMLSSRHPSKYYLKLNEWLHNEDKFGQKFINEWTKKILQINPEVVCFSCTISNSLFSLKLPKNIITR